MFGDMSLNLSFIFDRPIIYKTVKYNANRRIALWVNSVSTVGA